MLDPASSRSRRYAAEWKCAPAAIPPSVEQPARARQMATRPGRATLGALGAAPPVSDGNAPTTRVKFCAMIERGDAHADQGKGERNGRIAARAGGGQFCRSG